MSGQRLYFPLRQYSQLHISALTLPGSIQSTWFLRFHSNSIPHLHIGDFRSYLGNNSCTFMSQNHRLLDHKITNLAICKVMYIRSTYPKSDLADIRNIPRRLDMNFNMVGRFEFRERTLFNRDFFGFLEHESWVLLLLGHCADEANWELDVRRKSSRVYVSGDTTS